MKKRGQITIFILIGMIILIISVFLISVNAKTKKLKIDFESQNDVTSVKNYIENCLERSSESVIWEIGLIGGYKNPLDMIEDVPVYSPAPSLQLIQDLISEEILKDFEDCFDVNIIKRMHFDVELGDKEVETLIGKNIVIRLSFPIEVTKDSKTTEIEDFIVTVPVRLKELHESSTNLINQGVDYDLGSNCDLFDEQINVAIETNGNDQIVKFIDYTTYNTKYLKSYVFRFGLKNKNIIGECVG